MIADHMDSMSYAKFRSDSERWGVILIGRVRVLTYTRRTLGRAWEELGSSSKYALRTEVRLIGREQYSNVRRVTQSRNRRIGV